MSVLFTIILIKGLINSFIYRRHSMNISKMTLENELLKQFQIEGWKVV